jgi:dienelactone hydrolase
MKQKVPKLLAALGFAWCVVSAPPIWAQSATLYGSAISAYPDLSFGKEMKELGFFSSVSNSVFRPKGEGPFPAVVLVHTCGGLQAHITERAKDLLTEGFAVLVLDAYGPRNHTNFCRAGGVMAPRVYKDAFDALKHLSQMKDIDAERIYLVGFSLGSFAASSVASAQVAQLSGSGDRRFRASVGWYGSCAFDVSPYPKWQLLHADTDHPLLLLMSEKDSETPISECFPLIEQLKSQGKPVAWHIYPDATHGWDKSNSQRGYVLNTDVTKDATSRTVEFLRAH